MFPGCTYKEDLNRDIHAKLFIYFITGCEDNKDLENISTAQTSPTITFWFRLNKIIIRLCSTHQFKNLQVSYKLLGTYYHLMSLSKLGRAISQSLSSKTPNTSKASVLI